MVRSIILLGAALSFAAFLTSHAGSPKPISMGEIYVYYPSICDAAGDSSHCNPIQLPSGEHAVWQSFPNMEACVAHADADLKAANDPKRMGSCEKMRES